jgi:hypothetical protein
VKKFLRDFREVRLRIGIICMDEMCAVCECLYEPNWGWIDESYVWKWDTWFVKCCIVATLYIRWWLLTSILVVLFSNAYPFLVIHIIKPICSSNICVFVVESLVYYFYFILWKFVILNVVKKRPKLKSSVTAFPYVMYVTYSYINIKGGISL